MDFWTRTLVRADQGEPISFGLCRSRALERVLGRPFPSPAKNSRGPDDWVGINEQSGDLLLLGFAECVDCSVGVRVAEEILG
jgi:hypothetical protein